MNCYKMSPLKRFLDRAEFAFFPCLDYDNDLTDFTNLTGREGDAGID